MQAVLDDTHVIYVSDDTPTAEAHYRTRFYFDPNSLSLSNGDWSAIFFGYEGASTAVVRIELSYNNGYQVRARLRSDSSTWTNSAYFTISDEEHYLEIDWWAARTS